MRIIVFLPVVLALAWIGYWAIAAIVLERSIAGWFEARSVDGWVANYQTIDVGGFPSRFQVKITAPELADPETGVAWVAPEFRFDAASARPTTVNVDWPATQTLSSPFERITITSATMQGSVAFEPNTALALQSSDIVLENVGLASTQGWNAALESGQLATTQNDLAEDAHDITFEASGLTLAEPVKNSLDPAGVLPNDISLLRLVTTVDFDAPWDRFAIEQARPQVTSIDLEDLRATWGNLDFRAAGALTVDEDGIPTGRITIKATNWREMLGIAEATGLIPEALMPTVERAFELLASLSGPSDTLDAPVSFQDGFMSFGPIPLGPAPRLLLR